MWENINANYAEEYDSLLKVKNQVIMYAEALQIVSETFGYQVEKSPEVTLTFW